ncbi:rho GTPase-activating protein 7 isoform X2 [Neodiprion pinetum]|uniref:rho GTPase-activating protein 7 isoform X2 n=1 Tax=Neodiprion pinetum TaxID=441929 RepID=UPI001EDE994B|nr:uncharacterized protein LOC124222674 isoform X2 [Neodiprion pinetum]
MEAEAAQESASEPAKLCRCVDAGERSVIDDCRCRDYDENCGAVNRLEIVENCERNGEKQLEDIDRGRREEILFGQAKDRKVDYSGCKDTDPYRELELYLEKVNEEIGEIIESVPSRRSRVSISESSGIRSWNSGTRSLPATNRRGGLSRFEYEGAKKSPSEGRRDDVAVEWTDDILADLNSLIANEIDELKRKEEEGSSRVARISEKKGNVLGGEKLDRDEYKDLLHEFGISDSCSEAGSEDNNEPRILTNGCDEKSRRSPIYGRLSRGPNHLNSDYDEPRDKLEPEARIGRDRKIGRNFCGYASSDYDEPELEGGSWGGSRETDSSPLVNGAGVNGDVNSQIISDNREGEGEDGKNCNSLLISPKNNYLSKLPPKYNGAYRRKTSLPIQLQACFDKRRKTDANHLQHPQRLQIRTTQNQSSKFNCGNSFADNDCCGDSQPEYDDVVFNEVSKSNEMISRSKSLENSLVLPPKSAPVTPTEDKKLLSFSKLLRRRQQPSVVAKSFQDTVVLVRVSSLPDQDILLNNNADQSVKPGKNVHLTHNIRSISPISLRSDLSAKRLSESNSDVRQISPVELKKFSSLSGSASNNAAVSRSLSSECNEEHAAYYEEENSRRQDHRDERVCVVQEHNPRSGSLPISMHSLLSRLRNGYSSSCCPDGGSSFVESQVPCSEIGTQTSPALSRCSSVGTWVSDFESPRAESTIDSRSMRDECTLYPGSPQDTVDDDNRSSSSSQDLLQSMDEISSGSLSPEVNDPDRASSPLESGIGTASPPRSTERRLSKQTWERIRRRPSKVNTRSDKYFDAVTDDVWVRRESVHTQTRDQDNWYPQEAVDSSSGLDDSLPRMKPSRPTNLPLGLSTTVSSSMSSGELLESPPRAPSSPSAASLQLKPEPMTIELGGKSSSAPLLENGDEGKGKDEHMVVIQQPRSQSERHLSEIEAQEACKWLRAAGFPQYAQMYEDYQFPIEVSGVAKDHPFLDADSLQSLFRRLHALNRCANMKLDTHHSHHHHTTSHSKPGGEDSDEDNQCALSENWTFEKKTRRWSRVGDVTQANVEKLQAIVDENARPEDDDDSLEDRLEAEEAEDTMLDTLKYGSLPPGPVPDELGPRFRRTGSERLKDSAKAFLRRVESLKSRRRKRQNRDGVVISGPQVLDVISMQQKMKDLNCVDVSPTGPAPVSFNDLGPPSPLHLPPSPLTLPSSPFHLPASPLASNLSPFGDDSSSYCSDGSQGGGPVPTPTRTKLNRPRRFLHRGTREDQGALSDSECQPTSWRHRYFKDANSNHTKVLEYVSTHPQSPKDQTPVGNRGGSLNLGKESQRYRDKFNQSQEEKTALTTTGKRDERLYKSFRRGREDLYREEAPLAKDVTVYREKSRSRSSELAGSQESSSTVASRDSDQEEESPRHKGSVVRWHSFQRGSLYPEPLDPLCSRAMASMSCGQLLVLRKLALLKLTACMERYCPTHRTGWNWELPKFIRKIKTPDYKDKTVFGVPLLLSLQRTGQALPKCIQIALRWLRANALDQIGIFRKSGLRSRIQTLKVMTETQGDNINFDGQQAFDVADLVKQYFRELPESLLTNKLSETFIAIFQHVPAEIRPDAVQCVLLLLPDEHREALEALLDFLNHVANNSPFNQMTASNLAVCLAPSLFHFNHTMTNVSNRSNSVSPRRRKTVGIPDQRELSENKAANDCLLYLIKTHRELFMVSSDMLTQCRFNYMEESVPVGLEELGSEFKQDWRGYLYACTTALLKEAREKSRGWVSINNPADPGVEVAYKKVGDGHPLRLWRASTEVEAPPNELLHRVLRERHIWDPQLLKYRLVNKLDANVEVFQYATGNMSPLPARDYCVLRSWRNDLPKGACVIVETSVEHPEAPVMLGGTRGIVLASRYLIEPCGSGKSRIMHLSRVDTKGRTPDWYNKSYGHISALHLSKIRNSFKHTTDGPESKV